jgi:hypothetical protein
MVTDVIWPQQHIRAHCCTIPNRVLQGLAVCTQTIAPVAQVYIPNCKLSQQLIKVNLIPKL